MPPNIIQMYNKEYCTHETLTRGRMLLIHVRISVYVPTTHRVAHINNIAKKRHKLKDIYGQ